MYENISGNTIGEKIRELRRSRGLSQSELAEHLGVTGQAVSKWETGSTLPDMNLLPFLASFFGIAIDDLFSYSTEKHMERIANMIELGRVFSNREFEQEEAFLLKETEKDPENYEAISLLGDLYRHQANCMNKKCACYAKQALSLRPDSKNDINNITHAMNGVICDWNVANHHELIDYWKKLLRAAPENKRVYLYLLDNLIADGRWTEAEEVLAEAREKAPRALNDYYALFIRESRDGFASVRRDYETLAAGAEKDWDILFSLANTYSYHQEYDEALALWQKALDAMPKPRYTDPYEAMAQICIRRGQPDRAAEYYEKELQLLREDWDIKFGAEVDALKEKIANLRA